MRLEASKWVAPPRCSDMRTLAEGSFPFLPIPSLDQSREQTQGVVLHAPNSEMAQISAIFDMFQNPVCSKNVSNNYLKCLNMGNVFEVSKKFQMLVMLKMPQILKHMK